VEGTEMQYKKEEKVYYPIFSTKMDIEYPSIQEMNWRNLFSFVLKWIMNVLTYFYTGDIVS
jgi:hypothetical protein